MNTLYFTIIAALTFSVVLGFLSSVSAQENSIPSWIKNIAGFWADKQIGDKEFLQAIEYLIKNNIIVIPETPQSNSDTKEIPSWIRNNAGWWSEGQINDTTFIQGIQFLIKERILKISSNHMVDDTLPEFLFKTYFDGKNTHPDGTYMRYIYELKPEGSELYEEYTVGIKKHVVVFPTFTHSAYTSPGFYDYYKKSCDKTCLSINIRNDFDGGYQTSNAGWQILTKLGYTGITDIDIDKNPKILDEYDKVILLHNEYVTQKEFDAITSHPNVIYLYPNALYAKIDVDYDSNTITLVRGHGYPISNITNGFNWKFDNTHPYEFDADCLNWQFYPIEKGIMLNCYPEDRIWHDPFLLKAINDSENSFWWTISKKYDNFEKELFLDENKMMLSIYKKYQKIINYKSLNE